MSQRVTVSAAEISRLAGVGRAAVSNWRRRHDDFPAPAGGSDASPLFDLAEVEDWLRKQGKLGETSQRDWLWPHFEAVGERDRMGRAIAAVGATCLSRSRKTGTPAPDLPDVPADPADAALVARAVQIAEAAGAYETYEFLRSRWLDTHVRQISATPPPLADLMVALALPAPGRGAAEHLTVLDPACGIGSLLSAALRRQPAAATPSTLLGQEIDPTLAVLAAVRLAFESRDAAPRIHTGDTLLHDAYPDTRADAVICNPPFNERNWGHDDLAWDDSRWQYGTPPRTESELAWILHAVARLRPGGTAVLLMPPAVASRRAGRRIRSNLLKNGALRAVVALPPGAAPPHGVALHLWILRAPEAGTPADALLLVDAASASAQNPADTKSGIDWPAVHQAALQSWRDFERQGAAVEDRPGLCRAVRIMDLLDDEVDLTPARYIPQGTSAALGTDLAERWDDLATALRQIDELSPLLRDLGAAPHREPAAERPTVAIGDLLRSGHLTLHSGSSSHQTVTRDGEAPPDAAVVLTSTDMFSGGHPSGWIPTAELDLTWTLTRPGDVIVATAPHSATAQVAGDTPAVIGPQVHLLRPDPEALDPWFLAGCLRSSANARQAGTHASTTSRIDIRRVQVPRLPLTEQQRYAETFRRLDAFEHSLTRAADTGEQLLRSLFDVLASGAVTPE
ncbi:N-6 DNA methylase [Actinacidiphila oryziradicis]|uniref:N-6 DNA methylase n=1 Tax=Actinacidiphila oryziradicis TaxID=2571141 RepID=UPI001FE31854|nr:type I restriction-modification system subunit M/S [Actinacidiphila oryziradicis]